MFNYPEVLNCHYKFNMTLHHTVTSSLLAKNIFLYTYRVWDDTSFLNWLLYRLYRSCITSPRSTSYAILGVVVMWNREHWAFVLERYFKNANLTIVAQVYVTLPSFWIQSALENSEQENHIDVDMKILTG